jgi:hypothetical protein
MPKRSRVPAVLAWLICSCFAASPADAAGGGWTLIGWNDLGMHCMDDDFSVFSLLPPYNNIHAQLTDPSGRVVRDAAGLRVTYEAVADPLGSINRSSVGKTNFWSHVGALFGATTLPVDTGLAGFSMPGRTNVPQAMRFDAPQAWFTAEGIPIAPTDDDQRTNTYPMFRLVARDVAGSILATTDIVLPVSSEMTCRGCHASGSADAARPLSGWVNASSPNIDYRLNVLRLHDDKRQDQARYQSLLAQAGYDTRGLYAHVMSGGDGVLCAACHSSNALPGLGIAGVAPLTQVLHSLHANVNDPATGQRLDDATNRAACYTCHPGSKTRCLRGAMGAAVASDGTLSMQCQSCHGAMHTVGAAGRVGWLEQPSCQSCHTGTALRNSGQIRFASVFDAGGAPRQAADPTFATNANAPAPGFSLYRFSYGHGGVACEACHGSTHAEYPGAHPNDNLQSVALQGHEGLIGECSTCHASPPTSVNGGPHGMHAVGDAWVDRHADAAEHGGSAACRGCHGLDYRGTELSRAFGDRVFVTEKGTRRFFKGAQIGCYACHQGPSNDDTNPNRAPLARALAAQTVEEVPVTLALSASDPDSNTLRFRIVKQPAHGTTALVGAVATYTPEPGYVGADRFTYAAWDGSIDSNLAAVDVSVGAGACTTPLTLTSVVPPASPAGSFVELRGQGLGPDLQVRFGAVPADLVAGGGKVSAHVPGSLVVGSVVPVLVSRGGCQATGSVLFTVDAPGCGLLGIEPLLGLGLLGAVRRARYAVRPRLATPSEDAPTQ